jgi:hypothetical protein
MKDAFISFLLSLLVICFFALNEATQTNQNLENNIVVLNKNIETLHEQYTYRIDSIVQIHQRDIEVLENLSDYIAITHNRKLNISYFNK